MRRRGRIFALTMSVALALSACALVRERGHSRGGAAPRLSGEGRWLVDATGRVVLPHGVNVVEKRPPFTPLGAGFGEDDAAFLAAQGFTMVRVGVVPEALMPAPGVVSRSYLEQIAVTVRTLARHGIFSLLDLHQDMWGPAVFGNGMPAWMTIAEGVENADHGFPANYVANPATQRAFDSFWADAPGPDGVGIQTAYLAGLEQLAARFAKEPWVVGYDIMNEPWPGTVWQPCVSDCTSLEDELLVPFTRRALAAVRRAGSRQLVFAEPFVLFNFGQTDTHLAERVPGIALSTHVYGVDAAGDRAAAERAVAAAERGAHPS